MSRLIRRLADKPILAVLAIVIVIAGITAISPGAASAQQIIGNPGVTLYENPNFNNDPDQPGGSSLQVTESISCLTSQSFDNLTESIQVRPGTTVVLFTECGFLGTAEAFDGHDGNLNDNKNLLVGSRGGNQVSVSSVIIIKDDESAGEEHEQLLNQLIQSASDLTDRIDALDAELNERFDTVDANAAANTGDLLADAAANKATELADSAANTSTLLADAAANKATLLADSAANTSALLADAAANTSALLADAAANFSALQATALVNFDTLNLLEIENHANNPFEVTVQMCVELGAEAGISGTLGVEGGGHIEGSLGVDAYGNGASVEVKIPIAGGLEGSLSGSLGITTTACFEGVRVLDIGSHVVGGDALIEDFTEVGQALQDKLLGTIEAIGLGAEALVSGVDALVALTSSETGFDLTDPSTILDPNGEFSLLLASFPLAGQLEFDIDAALAAILNPCLPGGIIRSLGQEAADICDLTDAAVAETLTIVQSIPTLVSDLFTGATALAKDATNDTIGLINDSSTLINDGMSFVCDTYNSLVNLPIGLPTLSISSRITIFGGVSLGPLGSIPSLFVPAFSIPSGVTITPFSFLAIPTCPGAPGSAFRIPSIPLIP